jgi:hypothetical protein
MRTAGRMFEEMLRLLEKRRFPAPNNTAVSMDETRTSNICIFIGIKDL